MHANYNRLNGVIKMHPFAGLGRGLLLVLNDNVRKPHCLGSKKWIVRIIDYRRT
jgi:hypothetical protein